MAVMERVFALTYPKVIASSERKWLRRRRRDLLAAASGDVLEIGAGAGHNLEHYPEAVRSLTLTEANPHMTRRLVEAVAEHRLDARVITAPAEALPVEDASADLVVSTLVLCVADQPAALAEVRRVLRPGGTFLLLEHVAGTGKVRKMQGYIEPFTRFFGHGCHVTRDTRAALEAAGFDTSEVRDEWQDSEPKIYAPHIAGAARPRP